MCEARTPQKVSKFTPLVSRDMFPKSQFIQLHHVASNIYAWSNTPLGKIKVVIVGQGKRHRREFNTKIFMKSRG